ncbi:spore coat protein CotJB [Mycoplasmatota bacterium]|nr:spore coat protein CotJB [Mycoplasmatota bacterium]
MKYATAYIKNQEFTGLEELKTAFLRGSAFNNLYQPYKKFDYELSSNNKELKNIQAISFILLDLGLYLDTHPDNQDVINLYKEFLEKYKQLVRDYEEEKGPLTLRSDSLGKYPWQWLQEPWPWEEGE